MTEMELRQSFVSFLVEDVGAIEGGAVHQKAVTDYNHRQSKLPRGYKLKIGDAWCAGYASAKAIQFGLLPYFPSEVSCGQMIERAKAMDIWKEADSYEPLPGDAVMYDWDDNGKGDNTGGADHVGYVIGVSDGYMAVQEGNMGRSGCPDHVGIRPVALNGKYIRGFICPRFDAAAAYFTQIEEAKNQSNQNNQTEEDTDMVRFKNLDEVKAKAPWGAKAVEKMLEGDFMVGKGGTEGLDLSEDLLRTLVIIDRMGLIPDSPQA